MVTEHFTIEELTRTDTGIPNDPPAELGRNLVILAETLLEPIRALLGVPMVVHSGYRSEAVNRRVGGAKNSAHLDGRACDFHPSGSDALEAFHAIRKSDLPYDKILWETHGNSRWVHVQIAKPGTTPRRLAYIATVTDTGTAYRELRHD